MKTMFLAGASGVIGRRLVPMLVADAWRVFGTTRTPDKAAMLAKLGAEPVVVDVFDADRLRRAVADAAPTVVLHQLTDLPPGLDPALMDAAVVRNARIRDEGTRNLVAAAVGAGVDRVVAQSVAFAYADGRKPYREDDALAVDAPGRAGISARGVASLERQVLGAPFDGIVLRYGALYGPGTGSDHASGPGALHVDAAARAAALFATLGRPGIYNIAEDDGAVDVSKLRGELHWVPEAPDILE